MNVHKLYYYKVPGKAEPIRLALHMSGLNWEDCHVTGETWGQKKMELLKTFPQANIPLLEINGQHFVETRAILRYIGAMGNLIPSSPLSQLVMDESLNFTEELFNSFVPTMFASYENENAKLEARKALCVAGGKLYTCIEKFERYVANLNGNFVCGATVSVADLFMFCTFRLLVCGMFDGFDKNLYDNFPAITAYSKKVAQIPAVASRYANQTEGLLVAYKM